MGTDAILYAKIRNTEKDYNRIGTGLRLYHFTDSEKLKFIGSKGIIEMPFNMHSDNHNWIYNMKKAKHQIMKAVTYYQKAFITAENERYRLSAIGALKELLNYIDRYGDNWSALILTGDSGDQVDEEFFTNEINNGKIGGQYNIIDL